MNFVGFFSFFIWFFQNLSQIDASKSAELRKAAMQNCVEYNKELNHSRKHERKYFYDAQTSVSWLLSLTAELSLHGRILLIHVFITLFQTIQVPMNQYKRLAPEFTKVGKYPVALIAGQYQDKIPM